MTAPAGLQIFRIAAREMDVGLRSKQFYVSMAVSIVFIVAIVLVPRLLEVGSGATTVAVAGSQEQRDAFAAMTPQVPGIEVVDEDDADVVVDLTAAPPTVVAQTASDLAGVAPLIPYIELFVEREALLLQGSAIPAGTTPEVRFLEDDSGQGARIVLAYILSILLFIQIAGLGGSVAQGTLEEKGNRVVDVLFPKVPPVRILIGKVLGIGLFGLLQMVVLGAVGVAAVLLVGEEAIRGDITSTVAIAVGWFVLGYLFIGFLSGSVASTVMRPDQLPTVMLPLQLLNGAVFVTAVLSLQAVDAAWVRGLSMAPPFSAILMPIRVAAGTVEWQDLLIAVGLASLAIVVCAFVGGRVYRRSVVGRSLRSTSVT